MKYASMALAFLAALVVGIFAPMLISADSWEAVILGVVLLVALFLLIHWFVIKVLFPKQDNHSINKEM